MRRFLQRTQAKATLLDRTWGIIGHLEVEGRNYIINQAQSERDTPEKVFELLESRFGTGVNRIQVRQAFMSRCRLLEKENWLQYLDTLEKLRSQGFSNQPITTDCYEILQRFHDVVRDPTLRLDLATIYGSKASVTDPRTVESLRFTTLQLHRNHSKQPQLHDPRYARDNILSFHCHLTKWFPSPHEPSYLVMHLLFPQLYHRLCAPMGASFN